MDRIKSEVEPFLEATAPGADDFSGRSTRRTGSLIARSPTFRDLAAHPFVLDVLDRVLGDHTTNYQLHLTQVIDIGPGEPAPARAPRPMGVRLLQVPAGLRGRVPHDVGDDRLHRGERRDAGRSPAATTRRPACGLDVRGHRRRPKCRKARCCSTSARCTTAVARTGRASTVSASTSATRCRGCARRRTSTSPARPRWRARCPIDSRSSSATTRPRTRSATSATSVDPLEALHGVGSAPAGFATK